MDKTEEINTISIQLFALFIVLFSDILSIIITYNQKLETEDKNPICDPKVVYKITLFNRILILVIAIVFLYVNYKLYNISKKEGENLKPYTLQIVASVFMIISTIIALYVVTLSSKETVADIENPVI